MRFNHTLTFRFLGSPRAHEGCRRDGAEHCLLPTAEPWWARCARLESFGCSRSWRYLDMAHPTDTGRFPV